MFLLQAIPSMLLALVLYFDHRKSRDSVNLVELNSSKGQKYIWYALGGYAIGLVTALAAGVLTHSPQPALLYLVFPPLCFVFNVAILMSFLGSVNGYAIVKVNANSYFSFLDSN